MNVISPNTVAILPAGALGVSFYFHLSRQLRACESVHCLEQPGSASTTALRAASTLRIQDPSGAIHTPATTQIFLPDLLSLSHSPHHALPELILLCPNPDQLLHLLTPFVELLERQWAASPCTELKTDFLPLILLCSNGIYFQRIRQVFIEKLEESTLLGRLPDLWPDDMPQIVGRLFRGVSIQTGIREGEGAGTLYRPGPPGLTRVAGGDPLKRARVVEILTSHGGWFENAGSVTPTRAEFDKAMVNLVANLLGQLAAIRVDGRFQMIPLREVLNRTPQHDIRELAQRVLDVGRAVRAYPTNEAFEPLLEGLLANLAQHGDHVPSSLQWLDMQLRSGRPPRDLTPTEKWLLEPLLHYARSAGLSDAVAYFERLRSRLQQALTSLIPPQKQNP